MVGLGFVLCRNRGNHVNNGKLALTTIVPWWKPEPFRLLAALWVSRFSSPPKSKLFIQPFYPAKEAIISGRETEGGRGDWSWPISAC